MPFVRKTNPEGSQAPTDTRKLFVGRTGELLFFVHMLAFGPDLRSPCLPCWSGWIVAQYICGRRVYALVVNALPSVRILPSNVSICPPI